MSLIVSDTALCAKTSCQAVEDSGVVWGNIVEGIGMKVSGKVVVVTGAGNGIGREIVLCLLSRGATVAGVDLNPNTLEETSKLANGFHERFAGFVSDIADIDSVRELPEKVTNRFGVVDGLINNAGIIQPFVRLNDLELSTIQRVINVNLLGTLYLTKAFLPHLLKRPEGHIANLSSMGGFVPVPGQTMYCAAKAGVKMLSEGLASELLNTTVRVTVVFPGAIATNITANSGVSMTKPALADGGRRGVAMGLPPAKAAEIILNGIERNSRRVFVGKDSALMDKLYRLNPVMTARLMAKMMGPLLGV